MFDCPEHALSVAFTITELPIEPKSATLLVVQALEERYGVGKVKLPTGLSPHDWHAQAVMTMSFASTALTHYPVLWSTAVAEYSTGYAGALAIQEVSNHIAPDLPGADRLLTDLLVMRIMRRKPKLRDLADSFNLSPQTIARRERDLKPAISQLRRRMVDELRGPMEQSGLVSAAVAA